MVVSRMKSLGSGVRFVAVSATVPNIGDVATWLGPGEIVPNPTVTAPKTSARVSSVSPCLSVTLRPEAEHI